MRTTRKAASIAIAASLALSVAACAGGDTKPGAVPAKGTASVSPTPTVKPTPSPTSMPGSVTPTADNPLGIDWAKQSTHPFTGEAADTFGAANVMTAYRHAVTFSLQEGYTDLMAKGYEVRPIELSFVKPYLTTAAQEEWDASVKTALANPKNAAGNQAYRDVSTLTSWYLMYGQKVYSFRAGHEPYTLDRSFSSAQGSVEGSADDPSLVLHFTVSRNLRVMKGGKAVLLPFNKDITYWMVPNGLKETPWLIDTWKIKSTVGVDFPDPTGAVG